MHLGIFGGIAIVATFGLLPSYFWDVWMARAAAFWVRRARPGLSIYYDNGCGFCFKMVHILRRFLLLSKKTLIAPSRVDAKIERLMNEKNSWVVVDKDGNQHFGFDGFAEVFGYSPLFFWVRAIFRLPGIRTFGQWCYKETANNRLLVCLPEKTEVTKKRGFRKFAYISGSIVIAFLTLYVVAWNIGDAGKRILPYNMNWIAWSTRLDQNFNMFAPTPLTEDGWYVIPAHLKDGTKIDLFKDGPMLTGTTLFPVSYEKPAHVADGYPDQRWQKYLMNIAEADNNQYRLGYGQYLCRTWNASHTGDQSLVTFDIVFMMEKTPVPGAPYINPEPITLWEHHCF